MLAVAADHRPVEQKLRQLGDEIATRCGPSGTLARFDLSPGVVLVPEAPHEHELDDIVAQLTSAVGDSVTAVLVYATPSEVSAAAGNAAELLDILQRAETGPGLHRFADYALEFQLIRAGAGQDALADMLTPLLDHPVLVMTLKKYLQYDGYRRRAARSLYVHENTLTNRLNRISKLTGIDPASPTGMWYLRSALVARRAKGHRDPSFRLEGQSRTRAVRII